MGMGTSGEGLEQEMKGDAKPESEFRQMARRILNKNWSIPPGSEVRQETIDQREAFVTDIAQSLRQLYVDGATYATIKYLDDPEATIADMVSQVEQKGGPL